VRAETPSSDRQSCGSASAPNPDLSPKQTPPSPRLTDNIAKRQDVDTEYTNKMRKVKKSKADKHSRQLWHKGSNRHDTLVTTNATRTTRVQGRCTAWTGVDMSASPFPEVVSEIDANPEHNRLNLYTQSRLLLRRPPCWNKHGATRTSRHDAKLRVATSGIWALQAEHWKPQLVVAECLSKLRQLSSTLLLANLLHCLSKICHYL